jgi:DNA-binding GntR family transcriptional regulator
MSPDAPFAIRRETLATEVRAEIERLIASHSLESGQKLNEVALANAFGVSRGTVREAIRSLADSGLIDLVANRGAFVHATTLDEVRNLYDLRGAIFAMACSSAARHMAAAHDADILAEFRKNLADMRAAHADAAMDSYYELNIGFHDLILRAAQNDKAKAIYDNLVREMHLFRRRGLSLTSNVARSLEEHQSIVDAIVAGDADAARAAGLFHIVSGCTRYMKLAENAAAAEAED